MGIAENIKKIREHFDITQTELGQIAGVTDKAVSTWEKGTKEPRMGAIQKIADHFVILKSDIIEDNGIANLFNSNFNSHKGISTIAAHHESEEWTEEEIEEIDNFKKYVLSKRGR